MAKNEAEIINSDLRAKCSDLVHSVTQLRTECPQSCANYYSKIIKKEHEQLKNTNFIIPKSGDMKMTSKHPFSTPLEKLFPFPTKSSVDNDDLLEKLDRLVKDTRNVEEAITICNRNQEECRNLC